MVGMNEQSPRKRHRLTRRARIAIVSAATAVAVAVGGGAIWAAERFLVPHVQVSDAAAYEAAHSTGSDADAMTSAADVTLTDTSYTDGSTTITITKVTTGTGSSTLTYYVADVVLGTATDLRTGFADNQVGENITALVSDTAEANDAVFAINGDYYGFRSDGIEIRNGVVYRDEGVREGLAFYRDGTVQVYDETTTDAATLLAAGVWNTLSFGPAIVEDGTTVSGLSSVEVDTNFGNHSIQGQQPRTAVGVVGTNHLVFVVVDGRDTGYSRGATLDELASIMISLGATTAYNLDGGGSSEMWFDGEVVNQPSNGGERATSDILYIAGASS